MFKKLLNDLELFSKSVKVIRSEYDGMFNVVINGKTVTSQPKETSAFEYAIKLFTAGFR